MLQTNGHHSIADRTNFHHPPLFYTNIEDQIFIIKIYDQIFKTRNKLQHKPVFDTFPK